MFFGGKSAEEFEYIGVFIEFLNKIVDIILKLLNGLTNGGGATTPQEGGEGAGEGEG